MVDYDGLENVDGREKFVNDVRPEAVAYESKEELWQSFLMSKYEPKDITDFGIDTEKGKLFVKMKNGTQYHVGIPSDAKRPIEPIAISRKKHSVEYF